MRKAWLIFAIGIAIGAAVWLRLPPGQIQDGDLLIYRATAARMHDGQGYYEAMTATLSEAGVGPVSTVTAYRLPTIFLVWRMCCFSQPVVFCLVVLTGVLVGVASSPIIGLIAVVWLLMVLHPAGVEQWGFVEVWALPLAVGSVAAIKYERWGWACVLALAAASVRELCAPLLIGGLIAAWRYHRPVRMWLAATGVWVVFVVWHWIQTRPYLVSDGHEQPLIGHGGPNAIAMMAGPFTYGIGIAIVAWTLWRHRFRPAWWLTVGVVGGIPIAGVLVYRAYWGLLVLPLALAVIDVQESALSHGPQQGGGLAAPGGERRAGDRR